MGEETQKRSHVDGFVSDKTLSLWVIFGEKVDAKREIFLGRKEESMKGLVLDFFEYFVYVFCSFLWCLRCLFVHILKYFRNKKGDKIGAKVRTFAR